MKIIHKNQTEILKNGDVFTTIGCPLGDKDIDGAVIEIKGRYPDKGRVVNKKCKELIYIVEGLGRVVVEGKEVKLKGGDLILIKPEERYFWDGNLTAFVSCTPAWYPKQHREVD